MRDIFGPPGMRVQVILLDMRWFRSPLKPTDQRGAPGKERYLPDPDPAKTMLGDAQWAWLAERAAQARRAAPAGVVASRCWPRATAGSAGAISRASARSLFDLIRETRAKGVVLLSGDRHIGALYRETPATCLPLYEMTSSGINKAFAGSERGRARIAWAPSMARRTSASSTSTGGSRKSRWRCATKPALSAQ